jgi:NTE family protein
LGENESESKTLATKGSQFIALALSGGGSRAIAFHLGCLRALHDRGVLDKVRVISSVSGGSVIAAAYAYWSGSFEEFDKRVVNLLRRGFQRRIAIAALTSRVAPRIAFTLMISGGTALLLTILRWLISCAGSIFGFQTNDLESRLLHLADRLPQLGSLTTAFEYVLSQDLFGTTSVKDVVRPELDVIINACDLRTGTAFRFTNRDSGGWRYGRIDEERPVSLAKAVAASAAYPLILPPLPEEFTFVRRGKRAKEAVVLTDGGVFDNLGVAAIEPGRSAEVSLNVYQPTHIICLNASAGQLDGADRPMWWPSRVKRSFATVHRKAQDAAYGRLHRYLESGELAGFVMVYLGQDDDRLPVRPANLVPRNAVRGYPTNFAPMSDKNISLLSTRGEQLARLLLDHYAAGL